MAIFGVGTDIVDISRIKRLWERYGIRFAQKVMNPVELVNFSDIRNPVPFLAKRFAGKEACAKALSTGFSGGIVLTSIVVENDKLGRPYIEFYGQAKKFAKEKQIKSAHISLSDEKDYATAFVILEI